MRDTRPAASAIGPDPERSHVRPPEDTHRRDPMWDTTDRAGDTTDRAGDTTDCVSDTTDCVSETTYRASEKTIEIAFTRLLAR